ncbi:MAG: hypothetical protein AMXMBFR34_14260 [Myxococcaceae bacterium]
MRPLCLLAITAVAVSCRTPDAAASRPAPSGSETSARPTGPGPANLAFSCTQAKVGCDPAGFSMAVRGDLAQCEVMGPGSLRIELKSSNDEHASILVAFEGYHGPGRYVLDDPARRFIHVNDDVAWAGCDGMTNVNKKVTAGDPNCPSPACTVVVSEATPDAGFPRPLTFAVHCDSLCENGGTATCQAPVDFITQVTCG